MIWTKVTNPTFNFVFISVMAFGGFTFAQEEVQVETKTLKEATHIEFSGRDEWRYDVSRSPNSVAVQFSGLKPEDISELADLKDSRIKSVTVKEGINGDALVTLSLDKGLNLFDYQTDAPVHLVFDIFKEESKAPKNKAKLKAAKKIAKIVAPSRTIASVDHPEIGAQPLLNSSVNADTRLQLKYGIFDGGDQSMNRFKLLDGDTSSAAQEMALVKSAHNLYVHFPTLTLERPIFKNLINDGVMKYEIESGTTEENLQARLVVKLYNEGKYAVVLRTLKFFREKFPTSQYDKILDFLVSDTYFRLWQRDHDKTDFETAMARYKELLNKYPDDPSRYHTLMFIGLNYVAAENQYGALSTFQVGVKKYPESPYFWEMRLAQADALNFLNKDEAALAELDSIQNDPKAGSFAMEANVRRGDVFFQKKDYESAAKEYKETIKKYNDKLHEAPNVFFNLAESQFWLKDYKTSLNSFRDFLEKYPNHPYGGFAMTRIGEIFEMLGVNPQKVTGAFLESYYRFRGSPGAFMAKLYINMDRYPNMKSKEVEAVTSEIDEDLPKFQKISDLNPFVTLALAKANSKRGDFKTAMDLLTKYYQKNILSPYLPIFKEYIAQAITNKMAQHENAGQFLETVETYLANKDSWLKGNKRIDIQYAVAKAYENLNLLDDAARVYGEAQATLSSLTPEQLKAAKLLEDLPSKEEVNLRLAATYLKQENLKKTAQFLGEIKSAENLLEGEKVERGLILSTLAEKEERVDLALLALKDLNEHWKGKPEFLAEAWLRIGKLEADHGNDSDALTWIKKVLSVNNDKVKVKEDVLKSATELAGDIHSRKGDTKEAIDNYKSYLSRFAQNSPSAAVKYKLGKLYFDKKDLRTAGQIWSDLKADEKAKVWAKMADENLAQANWDTKYDRYINRAPAQESPGGKK